MRRLILVRHAPTTATRGFAFPSDEPLDEPGLAAAAALTSALPDADDALCSPALRCRQTARAAGLEPSIEPHLLECDFGDWAGRTLQDVCEATPELSLAWMTDPDARPHGGESLQGFSTRVGRWLTRQAGLEGSAIAFTHGGVIRAAVVHALQAPIDAFWRLQAAPLSITELHAHDGRWTVERLNAAVTP